MGQEFIKCFKDYINRSTWIEKFRCHVEVGLAYYYLLTEQKNNDGKNIENIIYHFHCGLIADKHCLKIIKKIYLDFFNADLLKIYKSLIKNICMCCSKQAKRKCGNCKLVYYCSNECSKKDWSTHKLMCQKRENIPNILDFSSIKITLKVIENVNKKIKEITKDLKK